MPADPRRVKDLFVAALDLPDDRARSAFLDIECGPDAELRHRLEALLRAHDAPAPAVDRPLIAPEPTGAYTPNDNSGGPAVTPDHTPRTDIGTVLAGRYKLIEAVGEGGMGTVWVAQQTEPVKRAVAVKLIKAGMDSRAVLARFEVERQALALMDHPNIARVLDGGTAPDGRPFFVMELVKGTPITAYCDARRLTPRDRLELFVPVCQAIQHAHQKGVIHRDIKPSNVLVALYDDRPVPKVIDFGIAKATGQALTDKTLMTGFGAVVGTPEYMSPEQASLNNLDVDTRSDVYALGVLLYELLAGSPPFRSDELKKAGLLEMLRVVREVEPPRPSTKLSTAATLPSLSAARGTEPKRLAGLLRGELDWIVMRALEKDRGRRYESASGFAADVQRFLAGEAVQAHPPSAAYRLRKFARRNRVALATTFAFAGLLIAAAVVSGWLAVKATKAETLANANANNAREAESRAEAKRQDAERSAKEANLAQRETAIERVKSDIKAISLQVDLDLAELRTDHRVALLRLARPTKDPGDPVPVTAIADDDEVIHGILQFGNRTRPEYRALREFITAAVLANGQDSAPLLPPITHDGTAVAQVQLSPDGGTALTRGEDGTARLWEIRSGRSVALLREANERVVACGFSPDGKSIYTDDDTDTLRFWDAPGGAFRARAEPRPYALPKAHGVNRTTSVSNDRVLKVLKGYYPYVVEPLEGGVTVVNSAATPVELWDTRTGRLVSQLNTPDRFDAGRGRSDLDVWFVGGGRWVITRDKRSSVLVHSAEDGRPVARLGGGDGEIVIGAAASPSARRIGLVLWDGQSRVSIRCWNTDSWRLEPDTPPVEVRSYGFSKDHPHPLYFLTEDDLAIPEYMGFSELNGWQICRVGQPKPHSWVVAAAPPVGDVWNHGNGRVSNGKSMIRPPAGRKYAPELARFAPDKRFVPVQEYAESFQALLDLRVDKMLPNTASLWRYVAPVSDRPGCWLSATLSTGGVEIRLMPVADRLDIRPELLELWAQVVVCGELGPDGEFEKWREDQWENKRQELVAITPPYPNFPFPGHVATDKLHWRRAEFNEAKDADKLSLAQELLRRSEELGDRNEAARWRREIERRVPAVAPLPREVKR